MPKKQSTMAKRWLAVACALIILLPVVRVIEAIFRSIYMSEHYGSFWQGLTQDLFLSEGWISYVQTPLGLSMTILPIFLICGAVGCFFLAVRSGSGEAKTRAEQASDGKPDPVSS